MVQFLLKLLLKHRNLAAYHDFHWFLVALQNCWQPNLIHVKESESGIGVGVGNFGKVGVGVGNFTSSSATRVYGRLKTIPTICFGNHFFERAGLIFHRCMFGQSTLYFRSRLMVSLQHQLQHFLHHLLVEQSKCLYCKACFYCFISNTAETLQSNVNIFRNKLVAW